MPLVYGRYVLGLTTSRASLTVPSPPQCSDSFVSEMVGRWRSMPGRYQSLLNMLPCDLFRQIRNRTLWVVGDSNAQRFYKQLSCFLAPFHWPPGQSVLSPYTDDHNYQAVRQLIPLGRVP